MTKNDLEALIRRELNLSHDKQCVYTVLWRETFAAGGDSYDAFDKAWEAYQADNAFVATHADQLIEATTPPSIVALPYLWWVNGGSCIAVRVEPLAPKPLAPKRYTITRALTPFVGAAPPSGMDKASRLINNWKAGR